MKKNRQNDEKKAKNAETIDENQMKKEFRLPRDFLLNIVSEFVHFGTTRSKELYKITNDLSLKVTEFLDGKSHFKLVEIAHALLKLWDEANTLNGSGLQKYLNAFCFTKRFMTSNETTKLHPTKLQHKFKI